MNAVLERVDDLLWKKQVGFPQRAWVSTDEESCSPHALRSASIIMWPTIPAKQQEQELRFKPILIGIPFRPWSLMSVVRKGTSRYIQSALISSLVDFI